MKWLFFDPAKVEVKNLHFTIKYGSYYEDPLPGANSDPREGIFDGCLSDPELAEGEFTNQSIPRSLSEARSEGGLSES